jgi:hypothetical protein
MKGRLVDKTVTYKEKEIEKGKEKEMQTAAPPRSAPRVNNECSDNWCTSPSIIVSKSLYLKIA